jgi:hypothetical protein
VDEFVNTRGQGSLGTATNSPVGDGNTMARTQNRPSVPHGVTADSGIPGSSAAASGVHASGLSESDRDFIREIYSAKNLDGTPFTLDQLQFLRAENVRDQERALRELGPGSSTVGFYREVIAAFDERIADAKSPMGNAIDGLATVLVDPRANENDRRKKIEIALNVMKKEQLLGGDDPQKSAQAMGLICELIKQDGKEKEAALKALVDQEKRSPGSVTEEQFRKKTMEKMGVAREEAMLGIDDYETGTSSGLGTVIEVVNLVADRRVAKLKDLIAQEKRSKGSVSEQEFVKLVQAVIGDDRQKILWGVQDEGVTGWEPVIEVMKILLQRRRDAIDDLFKRQSTPGSGVTNAQINQAIDDYDTLKEQALRLGISAPNAREIPDQDPKVESGPPEK